MPAKVPIEMPWTSDHTKWLKKLDTTLTTADGLPVELWCFLHEKDDAVLSAWAKHFRNHYCLDSEIDELVEDTPHNRSSYLKEVVFPDKTKAPGPSIRAGDFGEILVSDYLAYVLGYWVPRTRYDAKDIRNESTKGSDILGFKFIDENNESPADVLAIYEAKTQFSGKEPEPRLQDAVKGSSLDFLRRGESLNAIKRRLLRAQMREDAKKIGRFQNLEDRPYTERFGAAALFNSNVLCHTTISATDASKHPKYGALSLIVIHGPDLMDLVHELYARAANEA